MKPSFFTVPLFLTLFRLIFSLFALPILLVLFMPSQQWIAHCALAGIFILVSLTDFLDGYFARLFHQESSLGKALDPLADKFLLYSTAIALIATHHLFYYWAILLIGREFLIMGLRLIAHEYHCSIPVSYLAKVKTTAQCIYFTYIILNPALIWLSHAQIFTIVEHCLLLSVLILSIGSGYQYCSSFIRHLRMQLYEHTLV
jgi:CDP-diacylglycerol--glycerol-3-phosphate 3-phosphatidyltransferase